MTASAQLDGRIDFKGTFAQLLAVPTGGTPAGTMAYTSDVGHVRFNGSVWQQYPAQDGIVANAGGGQANATPIHTNLSRVATVATAGDSVALPASLPGMVYTVTNAAANSLNVFPSAGGTGVETINSLAANAAFALGAGKSVDFICYTSGQWHTNPLVP